MATPTFLTGEAFPNAYGVAQINIPFIVDPNTVASDGSTGAFRPLNTTDLGVVAGANGTDGRLNLNSAAGYQVGDAVTNYSQYGQPTIDYILDPNIVVTGVNGAASATGAFRPKTVTDFNLKTIKSRTIVPSGQNYSGLGTDYLIAWTTPFVQRVTGLLPAASTTALNQVYIIKDEAGSATTANNAIIVSGINSTIDGVGTGMISSARGVLRLYSVGSGYFTW